MDMKTRYFFEDLEVGMTAEYEKQVTDDMIQSFADLSGDNNPIHLDEEYAAKTMFKGRISHGMLSATFLSTIFGTVMPGEGCIYMSQNLRFKAPVRHGDMVVATVEVTEKFPEKNRVAFKTQCKVGDTVVIDGDALVIAPSRA